jgi:hypothetical protein
MNGGAVDDTIVGRAVVVHGRARQRVADPLER